MNLPTVRAIPAERDKPAILPDVNPLHLYYGSGLVIAELVFDVHEDVYIFERIKANRAKEKALNQEKEFKDLNVLIQAYAEI